MNIINYLCRRSINSFQDDSKHFTNKLLDTAKDLYKKDLTAHFGCVNAIEFSSEGNLLFSGGDDRRVLMWNVNDAMMYYTGKMGEGAKPSIMKGCHYSNIFCLAVDGENKRVLSGSNDDQVIVHDYTTGNPIDIFLHDSPVFSLSLHPNNGNVFASAADNGRILIYDIRESNADLLCIAKLKTPFHGVMFNPSEPFLIATANSKVGVHIWDSRKPEVILCKCNDEPSMAVRWNQSGTTLLALRNLLPIVIYDPLTPKKKLEFDSGTYFNACTMKSCSFAGSNDEYILSGSDDFNLYMWKIPNPWPESNWIESEHLALTGHRSIVNQVRYSPNKQLIATSGVEKIIKLWSPFHMPYSEGDRDSSSKKRHRVLCSSRFCTRSPGFLSHDYSQESVEEDSRMIHFFDSLLQNELDDMSFLPLSQFFYRDANVLTSPVRKKETRIYERLIRKKKKYLSKILTEKSEENMLVCSIKQTSNNDGRQKLPYISRGKRQILPIRENTTDEASTDENNSRMDTSSSDLSTDDTTTIATTVITSNSFASSSTSKCVSTSSNHSSGYSASGPNLASSSGCSKNSFALNFSESDDSNDSWVTKSDRRNVNSIKNSGVSKVESDDATDRKQSYSLFKRTRSKSSRCYRNSVKRKKHSAISNFSYVTNSEGRKEEKEILAATSVSEEASSSKAEGELFKNCKSNGYSATSCAEDEESSKDG